MRTCVAVLVVLGLFAPGAAHAAGTVTLCASDVQTGAGKNLRDALVGGGLIRFTCAPGTTIQITTVHTVTVPTQIDGGDTVSLDAISARAMFFVRSDLMLRRLTLRNQYVPLRGFVGPTGVAMGTGTVSVIDSRVRGSVNPFHVARMVVTSSRFENNPGYILVSAGDAVVSDSDFVDNPGAIAIRSIRPFGGDPPAVAVITNSRFRRNATAIIWDGRLEISRQSAFEGNGRNNRSGGAIRLHGDGIIEHTTFSDNHALEGGAIWLVGGSLSLRRATFRRNTAMKDGGAVGIGELAEGSIISRYSVYAENSAARGGALKLGSSGATMALQGGPNTFADNGASQMGGAIYSELGGVQLVRAVFTGNTAALEGGAIRGSTRGHHHAVALANSLIVRNTAADGSAVSAAALSLINSTVSVNRGGVALVVKPLSHFSPPGARGEIDLRNAIVSNNQGGNCGALPGAARLAQNGHNLQYPGTGCGGAVASVDPQLDALFVPHVGSPAYNGGDDAVCLAVPISGKDIYSGVRRQGRACSVGAVEGPIDPRRFRNVIERFGERVNHTVAALRSLFK